MIKTIELNGVKYQVDTEADIPPGALYYHEKSPWILKNLDVGLTYRKKELRFAYYFLILSCSDPSEAARLGVPVMKEEIELRVASGVVGDNFVDDISELGKEILSGNHEKKAKKKLLTDFSFWYNEYIGNPVFYSIDENDIDAFLSGSQR